ncbi:hypothetical protein D7X33_34845 [Butyricicoccus sp. 1XD8-22]|nr:hypothetical protein D7X33_34845 [Butyricicoccus sp. 1XD8-22]
MNKYIVSIKRADTIIPLTIKAISVVDAEEKVNKGYRFDKIIHIEEAEKYKSRMGRYVKYGSVSVGRPKTTKRYLMG